MLSLEDSKDAEIVALVKSDNFLINNRLLYTDKPSDLGDKYITVSNGEFLIYPQKTPERVYIVGPSKCGKSYTCGVYCKNYNKAFPKNKIIMFTPHKKDTAYDEVKNMVIVDINDESLYDEPLNIIVLSNKLVIFDDCDNVQSKNARLFLDNLEKDLIMNSRKNNTYVISLAHMMMNGQSTRHKIAEATRTIFFCNSGSTFHIKRYLSIYCGFDREMITRILNIPSRWLCVCNVSPQYVLYDKGCFLIK
jgi:hypothetical protein